MNVIIFSLMMLAALFVRIYGVSQYYFAEDELWHLTVSNQANIWEVIQYNFQQEVHPPLSYIIWHVALQFSDNHLWLRMPGIIAGILLIPSIYLFGKLYIGRYAGYFLAFLFAFAPLITAISISIRAYSFMMFCLIWAAIYVHRYCGDINLKSRRKSLILYSICCFVALELNHAACFMIFSLGLILIFQAIKERNKKDFIIISSIHVAFLSLVIGYLYILTAYYGFEGLPGYYTNKTIGNYALLYASIVVTFASGIYEGVIDIFSIIALIVTPIFLIRRKQYRLLTIVFSPLIAIVTCDYFGFYPFSSTVRNNLFLFLSVAVTYSYLWQILADYFQNGFYGIESKHLRSILCKFFAVLLILLVVKHLYENNFSRNIQSVCKEFIFTKSDRKILDNQLGKKDKEGNIFVTLPRNMWNWRFKNGDDNITIITDHLAKFQDDQILIYFDASSPTTHAVMMSALDYQMFFRDLFEHLNETGEFSKVKSFTFFDTGLNAGYMSKIFHPQLIPTKQNKNKYKEESYASCKNKIVEGIMAESFDLSWSIYNSNQLLYRDFHTDPSFECGRKIYILSFTPKFVKDEILDKNFVDFRKLNEEKCAK